jgi:hypothetical protein
MEIHVGADCSIEQIEAAEYNASQINRIKKEYGALRQKSKSPT